MTDRTDPDKASRSLGSARRAYDSPVRRERARDTRERILAAGCALAREFPTWDWSGLTVAAVAERAGVNRTTVYRHFPAERDLHDAVMLRLEEEAGVSYESLRLEDLDDVVARLFANLSSFAVTRDPGPDPDAPTVGADRRHREALLRALTPATPGWTEDERRMAAAVVDILWSATSRQRLTEAWGLDTARATAAVTWGVRALVGAIETDAARPTVRGTQQHSVNGQEMP